MATVAFSTHKHSLLWHCAVYPYTLAPTSVSCFLNTFSFFSPSTVSPCYIILLTMVLPSLPFFFFCSGFFLNLHSHLYIPPLPSNTTCYFFSQIISLPFYSFLFPSPTLSLGASNMMYSLSCFPECEECCCFRMSPA